MLTAEQNEELTQVAPGTPMGELLRRYWYPVAFTRELDEFPVKAGAPARRGLRRVQDAARPVRDPAGGLPAPAGLAGLRRGGGRRAALPVPRLAVRDFDGTCLDQPAERDETNFRDRVRAGRRAGRRSWAA